MKTTFFSLLGTIAIMLGAISCQHDPFLSDTPVPTGAPCDPDTIYFEKDILPILASNCATSGCHDNATHAEGIYMTSYAKIMYSGGITAYHSDNSRLYRSISHNSMPAGGIGPLTDRQKTLIRNWIDQGARNIACDEMATDCVVDNVSFSQTIFPIMQDNCKGCHSGHNPSKGLRLQVYQDYVDIANNGKLIGTMAHITGYSPMPQYAPKVSDCKLSQIQAWIDAGTPNN